MNVYRYDIYAICNVKPILSTLGPMGELALLLLDPADSRKEAFVHSMVYDRQLEEERIQEIGRMFVEAIEETKPASVKGAVDPEYSRYTVEETTLEDLDLRGENGESPSDEELEEIRSQVAELAVKGKPVCLLSETNNLLI